MERGGFEHLNLPSEYERTPFVIVSGEKITVDGFAGDVQERDEVIATAKRKRRKATIDDRVQVSAIGWQDPRDADGELLWPERFGQKEIDAAKRDLLETGFATQHQQRPVPQEGAMFKRSKFKVVTQAELTDLGTDYVEARGWDFAATEETPGTDPDYTVVSDFSANGPTRGSIFPVLDMAGKVLRPRKPNDPITDLTDLAAVSSNPFFVYRRGGGQWASPPRRRAAAPHKKRSAFATLPSGYARVSKADGSQSLDLQRDALQATCMTQKKPSPRPSVRAEVAGQRVSSSVAACTAARTRSNTSCSIMTVRAPLNMEGYANDRILSPSI